MMKYKAIIFDMDGTIVESESFWIESTKKVLERRDITLSDQDLAFIQSHFLGLGLDASCTFLKEHFKLSDSVESLITEKKAYAHKLYVQQVRFIDGFVSFHKQAVRLNKKTALATNANRQTVDLTDQKLNLRKFFGTHLYCVTEVGKSKPDPAIYLYAAHKLHIDPRACIAIEDSAHGIQAAKNAGMFCIGINTAQNTDRLKDADMIVNKYNQIELHTIA